MPCPRIDIRSTLLKTANLYLAAYYRCSNVSFAQYYIGHPEEMGPGGGPPPLPHIAILVREGRSKFGDHMGKFIAAFIGTSYCIKPLELISKTLPRGVHSCLAANLMLVECRSSHHLTKLRVMDDRYNPKNLPMNQNYIGFVRSWF